MKMQSWSSGDRSLLLILAAVTVVGLAAGFPPVEARDSIELTGSYAEWRRPGELIVDGQRVRADAHTSWTGTYRALAEVPLGDEVRVRGRRELDGAVVARAITVRANATGFFERAVQTLSDQQERQWLERGFVFDDQTRRRQTAIGAIARDGHEVARVGRILGRLTPAYVDRSTLRVYVVDSQEWNALAMGNGSIWVFSGLLNDMSDNELAIVVGHELAHYTHEHAIRQTQRRLWGQAGTVAALVAAGAIDSNLLRLSAEMGARLGFTTWMNAYGRDLEDQADRVGLRYAYEAGYDVTAAPRVWQRFREKYGDGGRVTNFFFAHHSQPSTRQQNLERELALNYASR
jgi:Zn-dependent protease with chaperone function